MGGYKPLMAWSVELAVPGLRCLRNILLYLHILRETLLTVAPNVSISLVYLPIEMGCMFTPWLSLQTYLPLQTCPKARRRIKITENILGACEAAFVLIRKNISNHESCVSLQWMSVRGTDTSFLPQASHLCQPERHSLTSRPSSMISSSGSLVRLRQDTDDVRETLSALII